MFSREIAFLGFIDPYRVIVNTHMAITIAPKMTHAPKEKLSQNRHNFWKSSLFITLSILWPSNNPCIRTCIRIQSLAWSDLHFQAPTIPNHDESYQSNLIIMHSEKRISLFNAMDLNVYNNLPFVFYLQIQSGYKWSHFCWAKHLDISGVQGTFSIFV